ncbi:ATP-binding protein [Actinophytocola sp.]|uniref:sensor histidine kinase n=1 Tax=Actinophytocola sp. TaxID=1872138 RepID=UPI003D6BBC3C
MLNRLLVGEKLNLFVIVPLVAIVFTTVPLVANEARQAHEDSVVAAKLRAAGAVAPVLRDLEREWLLATAYLALPDSTGGPLVIQAESTRDRAADTTAALGTSLTSALRASIEALDTLERTRADVLARAVTVDEAGAEYRDAVDEVTDALDLAGEPRARPVDLLLQAGAQSTSASATMLAAAGDQGSVGAQATDVARVSAVERSYLDQFARLAPPSGSELVTQLERGPGARRLDDLRVRFQNDPAGFVRSEGRATVVARTLDATDARLALRGPVEDAIARDAAAGEAAEQRRATVAATVFGVLSLGLVVTILVLSVRISRSVAKPLRRLTLAADRVSELANAELIRVADEDDDEQGPPRLAAVDVRTADEIGDLAAAINRVQAVAALLLERQVASRRNVAVMFGNVGRRTQNLVGRQLSLIDTLEQNEQNSELLRRLYRLDHLTNRLRRNANSLVVLSGAKDDQEIAETPMPAAELVRAALGEIEDFQRVEIGELDDVLVRPRVASDVVLLLAELLENATSFSPPSTGVEVNAVITGTGLRINVIDYGLGMSEEQLARENQRILRRERLDIAPTNVLGLFVVGRLSRRHGIRVRLHSTPGSGVTAEVVLPPDVLLTQPPRAPSRTGDTSRTADQTERTTRTDEMDRTAPVAPVDDRVDRPEPDPVLAHSAAPAPSSPSGQVAEQAGTVPATAGLTRRVRGAQLPDTDRTSGARTPDVERPASSPWTAAPSPDTARSLVDEFEAGQRRAIESVSIGQRTGQTQALPDQNAAAAETGLPRRVRGAQVPDTDLTRNSRTPGGAPAAGTGRDATSPWTAARSPEAARSLVDEFESGVRRAAEIPAMRSEPPGPETSDTGTGLPRHALHEDVAEPETDEPEAISVAEFRQLARQVLDAVSSIVGGASAAATGSPVAWFLRGAGETGDRSDAGPAVRRTPRPAGAEELPRRVRGASLPPEALRPTRRGRVLYVRSEDPAAAREAVRMFEAGVARAIEDDIADIDQDADGTTR